MKEIKAIVQPFMLTDVLHALEKIEGLPGVTVSEVAGWGKTRGNSARETVTQGSHKFAKKSKLELVVPDGLVEVVVGTIEKTAHTGQVGDGKIFVYEVNEVVKIRNGLRGEDAV